MTICLYPAFAGLKIPAESEEYAVYSCVIQSIFINDSTPEMIVIEDKTKLRHVSAGLEKHSNTCAKSFRSLQMN